MKVLLIPFILLSASLWSLPIARAGVFYEENFNFGNLDQNLVMQMDSSVNAVVTTNLSGNGILKFSYVGNAGAGDASVTTTFSTLGDFTNTVTAYHDYDKPQGNLGVKMVTDLGEAGVYFHGGTEIWGYVNFPSVNTNFSIGIGSSSYNTKSLRIRRTGNSLVLEYYDWNGSGFPTGHGLISLSDPAFASAAKLKLFLHRGTAEMTQVTGWFDDFVIRANQFDPTPAPRLTTSIVPAAFQISWPSYADRTYQVWYATALAPNNWTPLGPPTNGTGYTMSVTDWVSGQPQRFYRVIETP